MRAHEARARAPRRTARPSAPTTRRLAISKGAPVGVAAPDARHAAGPRRMRSVTRWRSRTSTGRLRARSSRIAVEDLARNGERVVAIAAPPPLGRIPAVEHGAVGRDDAHAAERLRARGVHVLQDAEAVEHPRGFGREVLAADLRARKRGLVEQGDRPRRARRAGWPPPRRPGRAAHDHARRPARSPCRAPRTAAGAAGSGRCARRRARPSRRARAAPRARTRAARTPGRRGATSGSARRGASPATRARRPSGSAPGRSRRCRGGPPDPSRRGDARPPPRPDDGASGTR